MSALEEAIHAQDPSLAITVSTLPREVGRYFSRPRFETALFSFLGLAGLLLAALGVYGLASYIAAERAREVGVRIALGATPSSIVRLMIRGNMLWTAAGASLGVAAAVTLLQPLQAMLFEVQPLHPLVILAAVAVLSVVALIGLWLPSVRASRIDPALALRQD
jgi:ABC-type antimicrobial peptide transport system permease subunit